MRPKDAVSSSFDCFNIDLKETSSCSVRMSALHPKAEVSQRPHAAPVRAQDSRLGSGGAQGCPEGGDASLEPAGRRGGVAGAWDRAVAGPGRGGALKAEFKAGEMLSGLSSTPTRLQRLHARDVQFDPHRDSPMYIFLEPK